MQYLWGGPSRALPASSGTGDRMSAFPARQPAAPWIVRLTRAYLRTELRGSTRLTRMLASCLASLQRVPVVVGTTVIYADLRVDCEVRRLDRMVANGELPQPDFVKCDIEGAEGRVFEGARSIVERADAPIVLFEANARSAQAFGESMSSAAEWLAALTAPAYRFFHVQPHGTLVPIAPTLTDEHDHFNLVAVPANRTDRLP
jgi:hypothetical protein